MIMSVIGLIAGILSAGALSLIPGLHLAAGLLLLLPLAKWALGYAGTALFLTGAVGANLYVRRLAMIYHPQAGTTDVLGMDPAIRMAQAGQGPRALKLSMEAATTGFVTASVVGLPLCTAMLTGANVHVLAQILKWLTLPAILIWFLMVVESHPKAKLAMALTGLMGFVVLFHPSLSGDRHQLSPLLSGLFAIPIALHLFQTGGTIPPQGIEANPVKGNINLQFVAGFTGTASGFLAGLGASSLASLWGPAMTKDEEWVELGAASETANDVMALFLLVALGSTRSGEAALLRNLLPQTVDAISFLALFSALVLSAIIGYYTVIKAQIPYVSLMRKFPRRIAVVIILGVALIQVLLCKAWFVALALTIATTCLGLWLRQNQLPNQVCFAALILPIVCQLTGLDWLLSRIVFPY